jgi:DnaJ-class molecular chaperone
MNPFVTLNLPLQCTDEQVRHAYQNLLRRYPPETHPDQFQAIQEAYSALRTEGDRWRWVLLHTDSPGEGMLDTVERFSRLPGRSHPPGAAPFRNLLSSCVAAARRNAE